LVARKLWLLQVGRGKPTTKRERNVCNAIGYSPGQRKQDTTETIEETFGTIGGETGMLNKEL